MQREEHGQFVISQSRLPIHCLILYRNLQCKRTGQTSSDEPWVEQQGLASGAHLRENFRSASNQLAGAASLFTAAFLVADVDARSPLGRHPKVWRVQNLVGTTWLGV